MLDDLGQETGIGLHFSAREKPTGIEGIMKRMVIAGVVAAGMLTTPFLAGGAAASPTNPNPNASCISAISNGNEFFGGVHGIGQFHDEGHPFGQGIRETVQTKVRDC